MHTLISPEVQAEIRLQKARNDFALSKDLCMKQWFELLDAHLCVSHSSYASWTPDEVAAEMMRMAPTFLKDMQMEFRIAIGKWTDARRKRLKGMEVSPT